MITTVIYNHLHFKQHDLFKMFVATKALVFLNRVSVKVQTEPLYTQ